MPPANAAKDSKRNSKTTPTFFMLNAGASFHNEFILPTDAEEWLAVASMVSDKTALNGSFAPQPLERGNGWIYCF